MATPPSKAGWRHQIGGRLKPGFCSLGKKYPFAAGSLGSAIMFLGISWYQEVVRPKEGGREYPLLPGEDWFRKKNCMVRDGE
jgi:hypothetical protein